MNEQQVYRKVFSIINHQVSKSQTHNIIFYSGVSYLCVSIFEGLRLSDLFISNVLSNS